MPEGETAYDAMHRIKREKAEAKAKKESVNGHGAQAGDKGDRTHSLRVGSVLSPFPLIDFDELCGLPEPRYQVEDFFLEESLIQFYGETSHGKSLLCWDLSCSICMGAETWFGRKINLHGPVIWINADGGRGLTLRAKAWREANQGQMKYPLLTLMGSIHLNQAEQVGRFRQQILAMDEKPVLIFYDTQSRCMPGGRENDPDEMTLVTEGLHRIKTDVGCTNGLIHHANVSGERERGSGVPKNECDTQIRVSKDVASGIFTVNCKKGRDHPEFLDFYFKLQPVLDSVIIVAHESAPPKNPRDEKLDRQYELTRLALDRPGITYEEAAEAMGIDERTVRRYADNLTSVLERRNLPQKEGDVGSPKVGLYPRSDVTDRRMESETK